MVSTPAITPPEGFSYLPGFLTADEQQELVRLLRVPEYTHDMCRGRRLKRGYAQFGHAYVTTGRRLDPAPPIPDFLAAVAAMGLTPCPPGTGFDQCIVTHYPHGAGIGWHPDAPCFGDCIMAISLGHTAHLQFAPTGSKTAHCEIPVEPGSLYVMRGPARWDFQHQVVEVKAERYSITFRSVRADGKQPPGGHRSHRGRRSSSG